MDNNRRNPSSADYGIYGALASAATDDARTAGPRPKQPIPLQNERDRVGVAHDGATVSAPGATGADLAPQQAHRFRPRDKRSRRGKRSLWIAAAFAAAAVAAFIVPALQSGSLGSSLANADDSMFGPSRDYSYYTNKSYTSRSGSQWDHDSYSGQSSPSSIGWYYTGPYQYGPYGSSKAGSAIPSQTTPSTANEFPLTPSGAQTDPDQQWLNYGDLGSNPLAGRYDNPYLNRLQLLYGTPTGRDMAQQGQLGN